MFSMPGLELDNRSFAANISVFAYSGEAMRKTLKRCVHASAISRLLSLGLAHNIAGTSAPVTRRTAAAEHAKSREYRGPGQWQPKP